MARVSALGGVPSPISRFARAADLVGPAAVRTDVRVDEPVVLRRVDADPSAPAEVPDLALDLARLERRVLVGRHDAKVACVAERVLAVRRHVVPLLAEHFVEFRTPE